MLTIMMSEQINWCGADTISINRWKMAAKRKGSDAGSIVDNGEKKAAIGGDASSVPIVIPTTMKALVKSTPTEGITLS